MDRYWAKTTADDQPGISVLEHCLNVGTVAGTLTSLLPLPIRQLIPAGAVTIAALHDVGKISPGFQQKCPAWVMAQGEKFKKDPTYNQYHQRVSQSFLQTYTNGRLRKWAEVLGAHHGSISGAHTNGKIGTGEWEDARRSLLKALQEEFGDLPLDDAPSEAVRWLVAGILSLSDWLGSDENLFPVEKSVQITKEQRKEKAFRVINLLELAGAKVETGRSFQQVFASRIGDTPPRPLQQQIIDLPDPFPAIYAVEDQMGSGKTEAALWLAYRLMATGQARGIYFGLPTRVTSDRIHRRVKNFLSAVTPSEATPQLIHGHAWLQKMPQMEPSCNAKEDSEPLFEARRWFTSGKRSLLAPFGVGTVDQALLGIVAAKWFFLRQFALAGKVVILDEVHSYDFYTGTLIRDLVQRLRELQATPVILSATLTARQRAELLGDDTLSKAPYPAITIKRAGYAAEVIRIPGEPPAKHIAISVLGVSDFDAIGNVAATAVELAEQGKNVVWIRNTVRHAQDAYRLVKGQVSDGGPEVGLLHSRFPAYQRGSYPDYTLEELRKNNLHEERWLWLLGKPEPPRENTRPKGSILISTQVVEQSVDIDADVLISDLAPTDMLLQRLGRLHRHERGDRGEATFYLVVPTALIKDPASLSGKEIKSALAGVGRVYDPYVLVRTWMQWRERSKIVLPAELREILEDTYAEREAEPHGWLELKEAMLSAKERLQNLALSATDVMHQELEEDREDFMTRCFGQEQILLLIIRGTCGAPDRGGNPEKIQLLNGGKVTRDDYCKVNASAAKKLYLNTVHVPGWWFPSSIRGKIPERLRQHFSEDMAMAVYEGKNRPELRLLHVKNADLAPVICYTPEKGLWLEKPPGKPAEKEESWIDEDGIF